MAFVLAAISLGFLGSFHCIGMCGPIALALPVHNKTPLIKHLLILSYNLGRMTTYTFFGCAAGLVGQSFAMAGFQQSLSIGIGVIMLLTILFSFKNVAYSNRLFLWIKSCFTKVFSKGNRSSMFSVGILNGLLPCGLVYLGIAGAAATGSVIQGSLFMAAFGFGTFPMMILLPLFGSSITPHTRKKIQRAVPVLISAMAILLILRGLNLGIPYVSPKIQKNSKVSCHTVQMDVRPHHIIKCAKPVSQE